MVAHLRVENLTPPAPDRVQLRLARGLDAVACVRALVLAILLAAPAAHADDCDLLDAAPGTGATRLAESFDRCMGDPDCVRVIPPSPRERHGFVAHGEATLGTRAETHSDGEALGRRVPVAVLRDRAHRIRAAVAAAPRLDASRIYLRRLYSSTEVQAGMAPVAWAHQDGGAAAILPFRVTSMRRDHDTSGATLETVRFSLYESTHPDRRTEVMPVTWTTMYPHGIGPVGGEVSSELARVDAVAMTRRRGDLSYEIAAGAVFATRPIALPVAGKLGNPTAH